MPPLNDHHIDNSIKMELVGILYRNLPQNIIGMMIVAPVIFWELSSVVNNQYLIIWYFSLCLVVIFRYILLIWYRHTAARTQLLASHYNFYVLGSSLTACLWGIMGSFMLPQEPLYQELVFVIVVGVISGAVMSLHASFYASVNYIIFGFFPLLIWLSLRVYLGQKEYGGLLITGITYSLFMVVDSWRGYKVLLNNLKLKYDNQRLNSQLGTYNEQLEDQAEDLKKRQVMIETLTEIGEFLPTSITEDEVYSIFSRYVNLLLPGTSGALAVFINNKRQMQNVAVWGEQPPELNQIFIPADCWALRRGQTYQTHKGEQHVRCIHLGSLQSKGAICLPMMAGGETMGVISIIFDIANPMTEYHGIVNRLIGDVSLALANVRLRQSLEKMSVHDALTDLYNRRYLEDSLTRLMPKVRRNNSSLCLFMFDVDHFKHINDQFGHDAGDAVLRELGALIKRFFRESDYCFRYGGEEFMVVLEDSTVESTLSRANEFRDAVKRLRVPIRSAQIIKDISVSGGISVYPGNGETIEGIISAADKALYKAKADGRDCVRVAEA